MGTKDELIKYLSSPESQAALSDYRNQMLNEAVTRKQQQDQYNAARRELSVRQRLGPEKTLLTPQEQEQFKTFKEFQTLSPLASASMGSVYNTEDLNKFLSGYNAYDVSKFGDDPLSAAFKNRMTMVGDYGYAPTKEAEYYANLADLAEKQNLSYYGFGGVVDPYEKASYDWRYLSEPAFSVSFDGNKGIYIPAELTNTIWGDKDAGSLRYSSDILGNEDIFKYGKLAHLPEDVTQAISKNLASSYGGIDYTLANPGLGYFLTQDDFNKYVIGRGGAGFDARQIANSNLNTGHGSHSTSGLYGSQLIRVNDDLWNQLYISGADRNAGGLQSALQRAGGTPSWIAQGQNDPRMFFGLTSDGGGAAAAYDIHTEIKKKGGILGDIGRALGKIAPIISFIPGLAPIGQAMMAGLNVGTGIRTGNLGQIGMGVLGMPGVGNQITGSLTKQFAPTFGAAAPHVAAGTISGGLGALSGNNPLRSGLAGGLGSYAGAQFASGLKNVNPALAASAGKTVGGLTANTVMGNPINSANTMRNMLISFIQQSTQKPKGAK